MTWPLAIKGTIAIALITYLINSVPIPLVIAQLKSTNVAVLAMALLLFPIGVVAGSFRWQIYATRIFERRLGTVFFQKHYWLGTAIGYSSPGGVGLDLYRWLQSCRRFGHYLVNAALIASEKLLALFTGFVLATFMLLSTPIPGREWLTGAIAAGAAALAIIGFVLRSPGIYNVIKIDNLLHTVKTRISEKILDRLVVAPTTTADPDSTYWYRMRRGLVWFEVIGVSLIIQVLNAVAWFLLYKSIGSTIPLSLCLLATPLLFIAVQIPVSISGVGVRELALIWILSPFGVPEETILAAALLAYLGILFNGTISAVVMVFSRMQLPDKAGVPPK